jgi:hypothetical protein
MGIGSAVKEKLIAQPKKAKKLRSSVSNEFISSALLPARKSGRSTQSLDREDGAG